jgi:membrane-bound lytic murein transglycosylase F
VLVSAIAAAAPAAQRAPDRYDAHFRKYTRRYFGPAFDWRRFKAQAIVESGLDSAARSRAGARGVMQLLPSTFAHIQSRNPDLASIDHPESNIAAGIAHARGLWRSWRGQVAPEDGLTFMTASYNAGRIPILRAQEVAVARAYDPRLWFSIEAVAHEVPRWRYGETLAYVRRIDTTLAAMDARGHVARRRPGRPG